MRWLALAVVAACAKSDAPAIDDTAFVFQFFISPTGNTAVLVEPGVETKYDYRKDGRCVGRRVEGEPFTPHNGAAGLPANRAFAPAPVSLAPSDHIAIGLVVTHGDRELLRGCGTGVLTAARVTPIEVELK